MIIFTETLSKRTQLLISKAHYKILRLLQFVNLYRSNCRNANKEANVGSAIGGVEDDAYETWSKTEDDPIVSTETYFNLL